MGGGQREAAEEEEEEDFCNKDKIFSLRNLSLGVETSAAVRNATKR